jgi:fructose-bisphosphate aldolase class I
MPIPGNDASLAEVAAALAAPGKGLLASDESVGTIGKRLEKAGLVNEVVREGVWV